MKYGAAVTLFTFFARLAVGQTGTVTLTNYYHPWAQLEEGDYFTVKITGAAHNSPVTVESAVNGGAPGAPFYYGMTDDTGSWSIGGTQTDLDVALWTEYWYVGGVQLTPANLNLAYYSHAPTLPWFTVWADVTSAKCPLALVTIDYCTDEGKEMYWKWSPISYESTSSVLSEPDMATAANAWNGVQSKLELDPAGPVLDIWAYDSSTLPSGVIAQTQPTSQECDSGCFNQMDECTGECMDSSAIYYVDIVFNASYLKTEASIYGETTDQFATEVAIHELGHALTLAHVPPVQYSCSEVQSIMYDSVSLPITCGISSAQASCDGEAIEAVYPSGAPYCPQGDNYCDGEYCND